MGFKKSIRKKYLTMVLTFSSILVFFGTVTIWFLQDSQENLAEQRQRLVEKDQVITEIKDSLNTVFFRSRGFYAFKNETELSGLYEELNNLNYLMTQRNKIDLTDEEITIFNNLENFLITYESSIVPKAVAFVRADDYDGLANFSKSGINTTVNDFVAFTQQFKVEAATSRERLSQQIIDNSKTMMIITVLIAVLLFIFLLSFFYLNLRRLVLPLELMKKGADTFVDHKEIHLKTLKREDEIGGLNSSLIALMKTIHSNEEDLLAQNEELLMQQDELQSQQELLTSSLELSEKAKKRLEVFSQLNHSLTFSLNRQELVNLVREYLHESFSLDVSFLWLVETLESSSNGLTDKLHQQFLDERYPYILERLKEEISFSVLREGKLELGIAPNGTMINDWYFSLRGAQNEVVAIFSCSRIGRNITKEEMDDMAGLLNRVSLSLERIRLYENNAYERNLNEGIVNNIQEGIFLIGLDGELLQFNEALYDMLSGENNLPKGTVFKEWVKVFKRFTDNFSDIEHFLKSAIREEFTGKRQIQYTFKRNGVKIIDLYAGCIFTDGKKSSTIFVNRDITKEYEIDKTKTELIGTVSHELRTPLSSIVGFSELLLKKQSLTEEKKQKYVETIYEESNRLSQLVNDFLDIQRMESGKMEYVFKELDIKDVVQSVIDTYDYDDEREIVVVDDTVNSKINADDDRIKQVFINLISNAIKFSPGGEKVIITLENADESLQVNIEDQGLGIASEDIPKLFEKFHRIDNSETRKIGGTGLGLSIVKEIVEQHRGEIRITSELGKGTNVKILFPQI